jgi:hypothetical protein
LNNEDAELLSALQELASIYLFWWLVIGHKVLLYFSFENVVQSGCSGTCTYLR